MQEFFASLEQRFEEARAGDRERYGSFLNELKPRLEAARELDRELNRHLAHRFNALRYLRSDELGLSRIIGDLLDPTASHGQGALFLRTLLGKLGVEEEISPIDLATARTHVEFTIRGGRRIDILVTVGNGDGGFCLAIENKPYAADQQDQLRDYLEYLRSVYGDRFLMVYLSAGGEGPSESSLSQQELEEWHGCLKIMAIGSRSYTSGDSSRVPIDPKSTGISADPFNAYRTECSLAEWLTACREKCPAERLRWFLRDFEAFCRENIGEHEVNDSESRVVEDFIFSDGSAVERLKTARAVHASWSAISERVLTDYWKLLYGKIEREIRSTIHDNDLEIDMNTKCIWLARSTWNRQNVVDSHPDTCVCLWIDGDGWYGVALNNWQSVTRNELELKLGKGRKEGTGYPWFNNLSDIGKPKWATLVPELRAECEAEGGEITEFYVRTFANVAKCAIPIIDGIAGQKD